MSDNRRSRASAPHADPAALENRLRELEVTVDSLADLVVVVGEDRRVVECNGASERVWGLTPEEVVGFLMPTSSGRLQVLDRRGRVTPPESVPTIRALVTGRAQRVPVLGIRRADGTTTWAQVVAVPLARQARVVSVWTDVTTTVEHQAELARMNAELEQRVEDRTSELAATIAELEAFSYSVSHDLRAPVRTISALSESLREEIAEAGLDGARDVLERICSAALRMDSLIEVLLELSSAARAEPLRCPIDITAMAHEEFARLMDRDPTRRVDCIVEEGIAASGDERLVAIVMHNLLTNAWKFTNQAAVPRIEVGVRTVNDERAIFVRDNGIGFDMDRADELFVPFRRLHAVHDFEGSGIGLAIVQRIVNRHGGHIWAESAPGAGATFLFTLPEPPAPLGPTSPPR